MSSQLISVQNNQDQFAQKTYLSDAVTATDTALPVMNNNGAAANWVAQIGETGDEKTEMKKVASLTGGTSVALAAITYDHPENTPVYWVKYDQLVFMRSTAGTAGTATPIASGTVNITPDSEWTQFDDTSGSSGYAYKSKYYNSGLSVESPESDWIETTGYSFYSLAKLKQRAKDKFKTEVDDETIIDWFNEWKEVMNNTAINVNKDYAMGTTDIAFSGTAQEATITAEDFKQPRAVWLTNTNGEWRKAKHMGYNDIIPDDDDFYDDDAPYYYFKGDNIIGRNPHDDSGTARVVYYSLGTVLSDDADTLSYSLRPYTKSFIDYARSQEAYNDGRQQEGSFFEGLANAQKQEFINQITPRDKTGIQTIKVVEPDGLWY